MEKIGNLDFAQQTTSEKYTGIPYIKLDCQAFVEEVIKDCGIRKSNGAIYNYRGSNDMYRNMCTWVGTLEEAREKFGSIPPGSIAFIVKHDGGEVERGYNDGRGNASHVGIVTDKPFNSVRDSTRSTKTKRDGVGYRPLTDFTHIGLARMIEYNIDNATVTPANDKTEALKALEILRRYIERSIEP